jgi:DNA (cytosine-5)-methyltransferase 1
MTGAYYNEWEPYAAQWLRNLIVAGHIAEGDVDTRDIKEVRADDLRGYTQCHFFSGIGGWSYALRLAGWDDARPVWTGSCPCQPFSAAGKQEGQGDERHLWPDWFNLIGECRPPIIFGEQVESAIAFGWLDDVLHDLESEAYACGAAVLPACSVGAPHKRDRLWFVADAQGVLRGDEQRHESSGILPEDEYRAFIDDEGRSSEIASGWLVEPVMDRLAHGIPARVDQLRSFGNAIVPQVAAEFVTAYMEDVIRKEAS